YASDYLGQVLVRDVGMRQVVTFKSTDTVAQADVWLRSGLEQTSHHGFPVVEESGQVIGVITQRDVFSSTTPDLALAQLVTGRVVAISPTATLRDAADTMLQEGVGRLPVMDHDRLVGILTRSDLLEGHRQRLV